MALCTVCCMCVCITGNVCEPFGADGHFVFMPKDTAMLNAVNWAERLLLCVVLAAIHSTSASLSPLCHRVSYASLSQLWPHSLFLHYSFPPPTVLSLWAPNDLSTHFRTPPPLTLPCSLPSVPFPLFPFPPLFHSLLFFCAPPSSLSTAAPMFLNVSSWDAFVDGFHRDRPFEQVVVLVPLL